MKTVIKAILLNAAVIVFCLYMYFDNINKGETGWAIFYAALVTLNSSAIFGLIVSVRRAYKERERNSDI